MGNKQLTKKKEDLLLDEQIKALIKKKELSLAMLEISKTPAEKHTIKLIIKNIDLNIKKIQEIAYIKDSSSVLTSVELLDKNLTSSLSTLKSKLIDVSVEEEEEEEEEYTTLLNKINKISEKESEEDTIENLQERLNNL
jgi:hypothetical protein